MVKKNKNELIKQYATRLGDDSLVLGHRLSEWCSNGPFLEEDIALTNIALDYIGRARMFYSYASELSVDDCTEDDIAYLRNCREYQNFLIYELPKGDFANLMAKQLIVDIYHSFFLPELTKSLDRTLSAIAAKGIKETQYHLRRSIDWVLRLGDGTNESHVRIQKAFNQLWGYTQEMFNLDLLEQELVTQGIAVNTLDIKSKWESKITEVLHKATLNIPDNNWNVSGGREGYHTEHLGHLLSELQYMQRTYPDSKW